MISVFIPVPKTRIGNMNNHSPSFTSLSRSLFSIFCRLNNVSTLHICPSRSPSFCQLSIHTLHAHTHTHTHTHTLTCTH
jgi:hypothetical protein